MSDNHPYLLVGYWTSAVARCVCMCVLARRRSRAVPAACCPCQTLPVMFLHANCRSARDARFHERNLKQQHVDTLAQQLGVDANTVIVCGGGFMGTNKPGKGTEPGGGGCKVRLLCLLCLLCLLRLLCLLCLLCLFANRPVVRVGVRVPLGLQASVLALAKVCRVVIVAEFFTSQRCAYCRLEGFDAEDFLERNKKARTAHCRRCNRTCDRDEMAALNMGAVFWEYVRHRKRPKYLDAEYAYRHGTNWDPPDWSSSNERLPADLAAAKQSVQQEERVKAALKTSTDALAAQAKREKQQQRQQRRRQVVDAANAGVMDVDADAGTATAGNAHHLASEATPSAPTAAGRGRTKGAAKRRRESNSDDEWEPPGPSTAATRRHKASPLSALPVVADARTETATATATASSQPHRLLDMLPASMI